MGKKCLFIIVFLMPLILGGCAGSSGASAGEIIPPQNQASPLEGKWTVLQELDTNGGGSDTTQQWTGSSVQFDEGAAAFGGHVWDDLSFKIKRVNAADYLTTKYITPAGISVPETREVDVVTLYAASNFLGEVMKIDDTSMIFFVQDKDLLLGKVSDQADSALGTADINEQDLLQDKNEATSGVLLGLKIPADTGYTYQTLWVAADYRQLHPVLAAEQLFFPRTSGFWELSVRDISAEGKTGNVLTARNVAAKSLDMKRGDNIADVQDGMRADNGADVSSDVQDEMRSDGSTDAQDAQNESEPAEESEPAIRVIDYIGNDYAAIEKEINGVNRLQVLPVDNLSSSTVMKVSDLLGDEGLSAYSGARRQAVAPLIQQGVTSIERDESGENFGLVRKNGHWFLVGRINYQNGEAHEQTDFDLKLVPPANLIFYDTLVLNWHKIKDRVPDALDAFTSPNKDIVLVKTKNKLTVYPIGSEQLEESPLAEIDLQEGATVIMAEWATGSYVESWENLFLSYGARAVSGNSVRMR
ncbi:MAG TPA: hypothetical protein VN381_14120 [Anaerovoracaceae bacterium]|nr:hypothetical protein [Anaerovoracaceae bacterium]